MKAGAAKMRLHAAILMQHVVILLPRPIRFGEMHEPVTPAIWIVDRKRADKWGTMAKRLKHNALSNAEPPLFVHAASELLELLDLNGEKPKLRHQLLRVGFFQE